uniref:hypothetical protein n=1 Tax=Nonomuraea pusilla TaxID=46177 RepID=UPI0006E23A5E|nr:hypothetical protein [Nonomuraea pusilla]
MGGAQLCGQVLAGGAFPAGFLVGRVGTPGVRVTGGRERVDLGLVRPEQRPPFPLGRLFGAFERPAGVLLAGV